MRDRPSDRTDAELMLEARRDELSPRASLAEALERLPEHEREALELRIVDGIRVRRRARRRPELVDGRNAIRIVSGDGALTYLVDPTTFDPIEWRKDKGGAGSVMRFPVYEELPATEANDGLLSIAAQHPTAPVSRDGAAFRAVMAGRKAFWERIAAREVASGSTARRRSRASGR